MGKHVVDFVTIETTKGPRSVKAKLYYEGGPFPEQNVARPLRELSGKDEASVVEKATQWIRARTVRKLLGNCGVCGNGVELVQKPVTGEAYKYQLHCDACGVVLYRGASKLEW